VRRTCQVLPALLQDAGASRQCIILPLLFGLHLQPASLVEHAEQARLLMSKCVLPCCCCIAGAAPNGTFAQGAAHSGRC
jgi:hypothetical protein